MTPTDAAPAPLTDTQRRVLGSLNGVMCHVRALARKGYLRPPETGRAKARGLVIVDLRRHLLGRLLAREAGGELVEAEARALAAPAAPEAVTGPG